MTIVDEIKARLDVVDVISSYITLKKAGRNYKALCPFHSEKTPSFVVNPDRQTWRCFGSCNEGGDIFSFVMKMDGYDFPEAMRVLADRAGVELREYSAKDKAEQAETERLQTLLADAAALYMDVLLKATEAASVRDYVFEGRGLTEYTVEEFQLGYAPDSWDFALKHFRSQGYSVQELLKAGLLSQNDNGRTYDRFRHRFMIPIRDSSGNTLGFGARALGDDNPKYLNSPQGPLFDKSRLLYGLDLARRAIRETETVVVVEGYMDVIQAHQAGYRNVVAQMGTALTEAQVQQIARYVNRLVLALDTDAAGQQATMRGLDVMRESLTGAEDAVTVFDAKNMMRTAGRLSLDIRVLRLPEGKDPDDFIRANTDTWLDVVDAAQPLIDYVIETGTRDLPPNPTIQERERVARQLLPLLIATEKDAHRRTNVQQLASHLRIPEKTLMEWASGIQQITRRPVPQSRPARDRFPAPPPKEAPPASQRRRVGAQGLGTEKYCLARMLVHPDWLMVASRKLRELAAEHPEAGRFLQPISAQDFSQEVYRSLFTEVESACYAGAANTLDYMRDASAPQLIGIAETIIIEGGLEAFRQRASQLHLTELETIMRDSNHRLQDDRQELREFVIRVLGLRLDRIKEERHERFFFTSTDASSEINVDDELQVQAYVNAQRILEQSIRDLTRRQTHEAL